MFYCGKAGKYSLLMCKSRFSSESLDEYFCSCVNVNRIKIRLRLYILKYQHVNVCIYFM